jgi:ATP-binding cassette subfamily C protein CydD
LRVKEWLKLEGFKSAAALVSLLSLVQGAAVVLQATGLARAISELFADGGPSRESGAALLAFLLASAVRQGAAWLQRRLAGRFAADTAERWRARLLAAIFNRGPNEAAAAGSGRLVTLALEGVDKFRRYLELSIPRTTDMALVTLPTLAAVTLLDAVSGLILGAALPILIGFFILFGLAARRMAQSQWQTYRTLAHHFTDALRGLETLHHLGRSGAHATTVWRVSDRYRAATMRTLRVAFLSSFALDFFAMLSVAAVAVGLGLRLVNGGVGLETALAVLILAPEFFVPVRNLGADYHATQDGKEAWASIREWVERDGSEWAERLEERLKERLEERNSGERIERDGNEGVERNGKAGGGENGRDRTGDGRKGPAAAAFRHNASAPASPVLRLRDVRVVGEEGRPLLKGISAEVGAGVRRLGIAGASGAGKSTLLDVIAGFTLPDSGEVWAGGLRLDRENAEPWRRRIAYIPQHPHLFSLTLADNVRFYEPDASLEEAEAALRAVRLESLVRRLPDGVRERVGEGGRPLSGGQTQRVALARALLGGRPWLLLDEPTSHLDPETELEIKETILTLPGDRLLVVATHRVHWMPHMDLIWVLDKGELVESGTHDELMARRNVYYRLFTGQEEEAAT